MPGFSLRMMSGGIALVLSSCVGAAEWGYHNDQGRGDVVCDDVRERLNGHEWASRSVSVETGLQVWAIVSTYPGWKEAPWEDLKVSEHRELVKQMLIYQDLHVFGKQKRTEARRAMAAEKAEARLSDPHRLQVWRTHLIQWLDGKPAPAGPQNIVRLTYPIPKDELESMRKTSPDMPIAQPPGLMLLATSDLKALDPRLAEGIVEKLGSVFLFKDEPIFVNPSASGNDVLLYRNSLTGPKPFCSLVLIDQK